MTNVLFTTEDIARRTIIAHKCTQRLIVLESVKTKEPVKKDTEPNAKMAYLVNGILVSTCIQLKGRKKKFLRYMNSKRV